MKAKYIVLLGLFAAVFAACSRDEESLFDKPAALRAQEAVDNAYEVFTSQEAGWEMAYFPNLEASAYGVNMVLKFEKDGSVSVTAKNSTTGNKIMTDTASTWAVKIDYGPLLTFDTYNDVFHAWSDPEPDGAGKLGDYEFLILKATPELVLLKGKKHSAYSVMRPMTTTDVEAHYTACEELQNLLFSNSNVVVLEQEGKKTHLYSGSEGFFQDAAFMEDLVLESTNYYPYCATADGIMMCIGLGDKKDERFFKWEDNCLKGEQGSVITNLDVVPYTDFFLKTLAGAWTIDMDSLNATTQSIVDQVNGQLKAISKKAKKNADTKGLELVYDAKTQKYVVKFRYTLESTKEEAPLLFFYDVTFGENIIELSYVEPFDEGAATLTSVITAIPDLLKSLNGVYDVTTDNPFNPTMGVKLTNNSNADIWFDLSGKVE